MLQVRLDVLADGLVDLLGSPPMLRCCRCSSVSKRAALGLGRVGSYAASTSGEIVVAFSTANRSSHQAARQTPTLAMTFVTESTST